jgi:hypothetical protein
MDRLRIRRQATGLPVVVATCLIVMLFPLETVAAADPHPSPYISSSDLKDPGKANSTGVTQPALAPLHTVFEVGDVFVTGTFGTVEWRLPDGTLNSILDTGTTDTLTGLAFDQAGNLYVTAWNANRIHRFASDGSLSGTYAGGFDCTPESIDIDQAGYAFVGEAECSGDILKLSTSGDLLASFDYAPPQAANFVNRLNDRCTLVHTSADLRIRSRDVCTGEALADWGTIPVGRAWDLATQADGSLIVAADGNVLRMASGVATQAYDVLNENSWFGVALDPGGTSFWATAVVSSTVYRINVATGAVEVSFQTNGPSLSAFGIAVFGERKAGLPEAAPKAVFVHGFAASFDGVGFNSVLDPLMSDYPGRVAIFEHYQDLGYRQGDGTCQNLRPVILPVEPTGGMPVTLDSVGEQWCDSWGDMALNAVRLHRDVEEIYRTEGRKVVLIANSMGAPIVRGFLAYSTEHHDGVWSMVDSVLFLEGAHDGSAWAKAGSFLLDGGAFIADVNPFDEADPVRPAPKDLEPRSDWYQWANLPASHLPPLPSYSVYGAIDVTLKFCPPFVSQEHCWEAGRDHWGDYALFEGTDDPHDAPDSGGARFAPDGNDQDHWQWRMPVEYAAFGVLAVAPAIATGLGDARAHGKFGAHMSEIETADCVTGNAIQMDQEMLRLIRSRMDQAPIRCQP